MASRQMNYSVLGFQAQLKNLLSEVETFSVLSPFQMKSLAINLNKDLLQMCCQARCHIFKQREVDEVLTPTPSILPHIQCLKLLS
jgi:hypothetical protein